MKLKQILLAAASLLVSASGFADTYAVWPAATEGETQIPNQFSFWHNFSHEIVTIDDVQAIKCWSTDGSAAASSGWMTLASANFDFAVLADKDLVFDVKIEGQGQWNVRLTAADQVESDVTISVPADGAFHNVRYNVAKLWPGVANKWNNGGANGKDIFTFALVGTGLNAESAIYFTNVRYKDAIAMPEISADATDINENSAKLTWNATFPDGYTNTKVTVDGVAQSGNSMELTGLTPNTSYTHTIVAEGELNGETFSTEKIVSFKTAREPGTNPIWHGVTDKPGFSAVYSIIYNDDKTLTVEAEIETEKETPVADRNFHIYIGGNEWLKLYDNDNSGILTGTTQSTFEEGSTITWEWYLPYAGAVYQESNTYVVGSENVAPVSIRIKASAENVTFESAEISYSVTAPAGAAYKVYYVTEGTQAIEATENPIKLTGLNESTEYAFEVYAVLGEGKDAIESAHAAVSFKTPSKDAKDLVYSDLFAAEFKNAFLPGESEQDRRSFFVTLPWKVVYTKEGTAVYSVDLSQVKTLVGLVPQIYWNGFHTLTDKGNGIYEYEFGAQELDAETAISHYFAYSGDVVDVRTPYTNWGMEKETPVIGEATDLSLSAAKKAAKIDEDIRLSVSAKDANGYYLSADAVSYSVEGGAYSLENSVFKPEAKGKFTITATSGNLSASTEVYVLSGKDSENVLAGKAGVTDTEYIQGGTTVENVTDDNLTSQLEWSCGETEEHYLIYDLGGKYAIEGIDLLFEGAYATEFTITLTNNRPAELGSQAPASAPAAFAGEEAAADVVFSPEKNDIQHYFVQNPSGTHSFVALRTQKALNKDWGIKVRDLKVYATKDIPSGIETIDATDAPAEYYNLQGMRVANPTAGIYICRQGSKTFKVLIK